MRKRSVLIILSILIATAILMFTIIGCSGTGTSSSPNITSEPGQTIGSQTVSSPVQASELLVFAATGTKPAIDEAATLFEQKYGTKITVNYGGGGEVLSNMVLAKKGDIFIAPEQRFMNSAKKQGAVDSFGTPASLAYMIPVIGVKKGNPQNIKALADLSKSGLKLVMGNPDTTALGDIVPQMLQKAGVYDAVKGNFVTNAAQVTAIITMLKMNQVDAGFIWHYFGTTSAADVDIVWIPKENVTGIGEIQAAVSTYSQRTKTADLFINLLKSSEGQAIFKKNGYIVDLLDAAKYWLATQ